MTGIIGRFKPIRVDSDPESTTSRMATGGGRRGRQGSDGARPGREAAGGVGWRRGGGDLTGGDGKW